MIAHLVLLAAISPSDVPLAIEVQDVCCRPYPGATVYLSAGDWSAEGTTNEHGEFFISSDQGPPPRVVVIALVQPPLNGVDISGESAAIRHGRKYKVAKFTIRPTEGRVLVLKYEYKDTTTQVDFCPGGMPQPLFNVESPADSEQAYSGKPARYPVSRYDTIEGWTLGPDRVYN